MKPTTGNAKPRRLAAPRKRVRLDLQRRPQPEPERDLEESQKSNFWKWVLLVALLHMIAIGLVYFIYEMAPVAKPPDPFISLMPPGDTVKGTAGTQQAHKLGPTTPAPSKPHTASAASQPPKPIPAKPIVQKPPPKAEMKITPPTLLTDKPIAPPTPAPPKPPKVKIDLTKLEDAPQSADKPKPKPHVKKPVVKTTDDSHDEEPHPNSSGLSKDEIAAKLGDKLDAAGVKNATKIGANGSDHSKTSPFADFYALLHDQVMEEWVVPNLIDDSAANPVVEIHVEKDGKVPPESVHLTHSSGNQAYDDSAVTAAKNLGYLHEPLPDGCPPDISITFKPNR